MWVVLCADDRLAHMLIGLLLTQVTDRGVKVMRTPPAACLTPAPCCPALRLRLTMMRHSTALTCGSSGPRCEAPRTASPPVSAVAPSLAATIAHLPRPPLTPLTQQLGLDDYGTIRVINFIRAEVAAGRDPRPALSTAAAGSSSAGTEAGAAAPWSSDTFLQPVLADDPLLTYDFDDEQQQQDRLAAAMGGLRWVVCSGVG